MSFGKNLSQLFNNETVPISTVAKIVSVAGYADMVLQWVLPTAPAGAPATTITIFSSPLPYDDKRLADTVPANNPFWTEETDYGAVFSTLPDDTKNSDRLTLSAAPFGSLLVVFGVTVEMIGFSFLIRGQERT